MQRYRMIAPDNQHLIPNGAEVRFEWGPVYGCERGWVVGRVANHYGAHLLVLSQRGRLETISGISTIGIGVHLADRELAAQFVNGGEA